MVNLHTIKKIAQEHCANGFHRSIQRFRVSAIITDKRGRIISKATNSYSKTHPIQKEYADRVNRPTKIYLHAEIAALVKCRKIPYTIYVSRYFKDGSPAMAKPCPVCELAMHEAGVKRVVYTTESGYKELRVA